VISDDAPGGRDAGRSALLIRRHRYTGTCSFYRCWTPGPVPLVRLIATAVARWRIEEDHQLSKQDAGLDAGQVIRWRSWHRWSALCLLAFMYLAVAAALDRDAYAGLEIGLIRSPSSKCCACCAAPSSRRLVGTTPTASTGRNGGAATSTGPAKPTSAGMPTQMPHRRPDGVAYRKCCGPGWLRVAGGQLAGTA
jgi:hypothetical protein